MPAGIFLFFIILRVVFVLARNKKNGRPTVISWVTMRWKLLMIFWISALVISGVVAFVGIVDRHTPFSAAATGALAFIAVAISSVLFFRPWWLLLALARRGKVKTAYYAALVLRLSHPTGEPYGGACFSAGLALAHRGSVTRQELMWLDSRLAKEKRALGLFAAAFALLQALEGRLAKDSGRLADAAEFRNRARSLFGTITYLAPAAIPPPVRIFASEYLTLDAATRGEWSAVESVQAHDLSPTTLAIRSWTRKNLQQLQEKSTRALRRAEKQPIALRLASRAAREPDQNEAVFFARSSEDYVALIRGEPLPPRAVLNLLAALDLFFDPHSPATHLPPELIADETACADIADAIADAVFEPLKMRGAPIFAMPMHGAISARVYQKLESHVTNELKSALTATRDRTTRVIRGTNREEWLEVSKVRALYRRIEYTLGTAAAGAQAHGMFFNYGHFGVMLSESIPRRRPLAHAVFHCLRNEAHRYQNVDALARENKNMTVTCRAD